MSEANPHIYEFGDFRLDVARRLLLRRDDDQPVKLTSKAFDTLLYLARHGGTVLDKDELLRAVWPDTIVEENNLSQNISALRRALGEKQGENRYIVTVPGRGFSFVATVTPLVGGDATPVIDGELPELRDKEVSKSPAAPGLHQSAWKQPRLIILASLIIVALSAAAFYLFRVSTKITPPVPVRTMAVLPFKPVVLENRDEAFEMGMADTLIVRLSNLREVSVRPISSVRRFNGLEQDPVAAGRELAVESVLDGQIQRWGDRIRVTARLIDVGDGKQLWADQFDEKFTDIFTLQDLIAEKVTAALELKLTGEEKRRLTKHYTDNAEAYQLYINGRFYWEKRTQEGLKRAIEYFEEAIEKDENYALAYAGLADSYAVLGVLHLPPKEAFPKAKEATLKALRIDDSLAEAHAALGHIKVQYDYDWVGAEREYKRAIELNPNYANAHHFYALYLAMMGRSDAGLAEIRRAQELEPFSLFIHAHVGALLSRAGRYDEAINQLKRVLEMNPNFDHARGILGYAYLRKGMYEQAIAETQKLATSPYNYYRALGQAYALSGRRSEALKEIDRLRELSKQGYVVAYNLAVVYASLGDKDNALEWLEKAYEDRATFMVWIRVDPQLDNLRSEPRFQAIIKRMGIG